MSKPFNTMTVSELAAYRGPIYRATVSWTSADNGQRVYSDQEAPDMTILSQQVGSLEMCYRERGCNPSVSWGPHTEHGSVFGGGRETIPPRPAKLYALQDNDGEVLGIYSTLDMAAKAMERFPHCAVEERELDKLPDEPEPPAPTERELEEKQQRDRGWRDAGREYDKYEHEEFRGGER